MKICEKFRFFSGNFAFYISLNIVFFHEGFCSLKTLVKCFKNSIASRCYSTSPAALDTYYLFLNVNHIKMQEEKTCVLF